MQGSPQMLCQKTLSCVIPSFGALVEIPEDSDNLLSVVLVFNQPCLDAFFANMKTLDSLVDGERTMVQLMQAHAQRFVTVEWAAEFGSYLYPVPL
eukprot:159894-Rhodomonas_salina.1